MIDFFCSDCGMKFRVKDEFAGRTTRCPTCKRQLVVPPAKQLQEKVEAEGIEGTSSSLVQAGIEARVSLEVKQPSSQKTVQDLLQQRAGRGQRYVVEKEMARGGMGAVLRAVDCDIRREVAVKYLLNQEDARKKLRFIEEAQITGQLEHPNIVPIHELGLDARKRLFFTMKLIKGRSLAQVLDALRAQPASAGKEYPLNRLLNILVNVCNALAYAHARGVIHRDLKPANIMIGDFGEVYVMDWGLAKVLRNVQASDIVPTASYAVGSGPAPAAIPLSGSGTSVATDRVSEADLTQEGSILGTPAYMPPEQASGRLQDIDQRSDVYSLGAILYEMLTMQPPIHKDGGYMAILMRVVQGEILPPEERSPDRARSGQIPRELSAIAMKALARDPHYRYPRIEQLRSDIERFQEGRSVSAKEDSFREAVWKLVKRNKAVSLVAGVALLLVTFIWGQSSWTNYQERKARETVVRDSIPAFVRAARLFVSQKNFGDALSQVNVALQYETNDADARLLKGQILIVQKKFSEAKDELDRYLKLRPQDREAAELARLCSQARQGDASSVGAFVPIFLSQQAPVLAESMVQSREELLKLYRQRVETAWPGLGKHLAMDKDGNCSLSFSDTPFSATLTDLGPLKNISLVSLNLQGCGNLKDLTPLFGMKLTNLDLTNVAKIQDLSPLAGMPLVNLNLRNCYEVYDLSPLKGMPITVLNLHNCYKVRDLTPLNGMKLTSLNLIACAVTDLSPLRGMPLTYLVLSYCNVGDLSPLRGMPLTVLSLMAIGKPLDLTPLQGMNLTEVIITPRNVRKGMDVLREMKSLKTISLDGTQKYPVAEFWELYDSGRFGKPN